MNTTTEAPDWGEGGEAGGDQLNDGVEQMVTLYRVHPQDVTRCKQAAFLGRYVVVGLSLVMLLLSDLSAPKCGDSDRRGRDKCVRSVWGDMLFYVVVMATACLLLPNVPIVLSNLWRKNDNHAPAVSLWRAILWPAVETDFEVKFYLGAAIHYIPLGCFLFVIGMMDSNGQLPTWLMITLPIAACLAGFVGFYVTTYSTVGVVWSDLSDREKRFVVSRAMKLKGGWMARTMTEHGVMMMPAVGRILRLAPIHYPLHDDIQQEGKEEDNTAEASTPEEESFIQ